MTAPDLERKVRQLDNDVSDIYAMLTTIGDTQMGHTNRLDELQKDLGGLKTDVGELKTDVGELNGLHGRMARLESKVEQVLDLLQR